MLIRINTDSKIEVKMLSIYRTPLHHVRINHGFECKQ